MNLDEPYETGLTPLRHLPKFHEGIATSHSLWPALPGRPEQKIPKATGKRRVSLHVTLGKGMREFDYDAPWKSLHDALQHAKLMGDDACPYLELGPLTFSQDWQGWGARMTLEDV